MLKRGLETYSRTDRGAILQLKDAQCTRILHLIPHHLRDDFFDEYGVRIEGNLSPLNVMRLEQEYGSKLRM